MNLFRRLFETRASPSPAGIGGKLKAFLMGEDSVYVSSAGAQVDERTAMGVSAVYACVRVLAETVASLPFPLYTKTKDGREKAASHPLYPILHDMPNPDMTSFSFRETMMTSLLLWGNAYALIGRSGGHIRSLYPLQPSKIRLERDEKTHDLRYIYSDGVKTATYTSDQIFHISGLSYDGLLGISPIAQAREAIGLSLATEEYGSRFFANGARPGAVLEHPGVVKDPAKLRESWEAIYKGTKNSHKIAVLEEGLKYHEIGIPPEDAQFLETRRFQINEICRIFRVPPHLVGDLERSTNNNIEHQSIEFVVHTIRPWLVRWEQAVYKCLLTEAERLIYFAKFNVDGLLRGDFKTRMEGYAIGRQNGWLSANEIRAMEEMNPIPDGEIYLLNGNMVTAVKAASNGGEQIGKGNGTPDSGSDRT